MNSIKNFCDSLSVMTLISTLAGWLPNVAALATLIWTILRIYEMETVQKHLKKRKEAE